MDLILRSLLYLILFYEAFTQNGTEDYIQGAVKSLLGVKDDVEISGSSNRRILEPPKYMLDLYNTYKKGDKPTQGNTVRSILPMQGKSEGFDMLIFNLTGVNPEEEILQGWFHVFRRRQARGHRRKDAISYRLKVSDLEFSSEVIYVDIQSNKKAGWFSYNVTDSVIKCRTIKKDTDYLLGVTAEMKRSNGKYRTVSLRRVARLNSQPFLIIFSEDRNRSAGKENHDVLPTVGYANSSVLFSHSQNSEHFALEESRMRRKRSIKKSRNLSNSNFSNAPGKSKPVTSNDVIYDTIAENNPSEDSNVGIKFSKKLDPDIVSLQHKKRVKHFRRPKGRKQFRKLPFWWLKYDGKHRGHNTGQTCRKKKLQVDFAGIGWKEWVISPISYDASYCSGSCSFPLIKNGNPSNHAIIQSLVRSWSSKTSIPAPCCVPSSTSPLTLLYIDENSNVILKSYPNMIVDSCACK